LKLRLQPEDDSVDTRTLVTTAMAAADADTPPVDPDPGPSPLVLRQHARAKVNLVLGPDADADATPAKWDAVQYEGKRFIRAVIGGVQFLYQDDEDRLYMVRRDGEAFPVDTLADVGRLFQQDGPRAYVGELV
jgi:hypothetical protein